LWDPEHRESGLYTVDDCLADLDSSGGSTAHSIRDAEDNGVNEADFVVESLTPTNSLRPTNGSPFEVP
jgi:hypothetical protein